MLGRMQITAKAKAMAIVMSYMAGHDAWCSIATSGLTAPSWPLANAMAMAMATAIHSQLRLSSYLAGRAIDAIASLNLQ